MIANKNIRANTQNEVKMLAPYEEAMETSDVPTRRTIRPIIMLKMPAMSPKTNADVLPFLFISTSYNRCYDESRRLGGKKHILNAYFDIIYKNILLDDIFSVKQISLRKSLNLTICK